MKINLVIGLLSLSLFGGGSYYYQHRSMLLRLTATYTAIEIQEATRAARLAEARDMQWRAIEESYIIPAWGLVHTGAPLFVLSIGGLIVLAGALVLVGMTDFYLLRRRQMSLIWPNQQGELPVDSHQITILNNAALAILHNRQQIDLTRILAAYGNTGRTLSQLPSSVDGLPSAPPYSQLLSQGWHPSMEKFLLGYSHAGPIHGGVDELLSVLVIGRPGTGKTNLLRFMLAQLLDAGSEVAIMDLHGSLSDLANLGGAVRWYSESRETTEKLVATLTEELEKRLAQYRKGKRDFRPLLFLVDEWNILAEAVPEAIIIAKRFILEARKVRAYALISGQSAPAKTFGDSTARDNLSSRYIGWTTPNQARMAGLDASPDEIKTMLGMLKEGKTGRAILARSSEEPVIVAIPYTTAGDLDRVVDGKYRVIPSESENKGFARSKPADKVFHREELTEKLQEEPSIKSGSVPEMEPEEVEQIKEWRAEGLTCNAIAKKIGGRRETALQKIRTAMQQE